MTTKMENTRAFIVKTCQVKCLNALDFVLFLTYTYFRCCRVKYCDCFYFFLFVICVCLHPAGEYVKNGQNFPLVGTNSRVVCRGSKPASERTICTCYIVHCTYIITLYWSHSTLYLHHYSVFVIFL